MDYEKLYREANKKVAVRFGSNVAKELFPDLYESKDERIRKAIINLVETEFGDRFPFNGFTREQMLAYLEKQGEQKPVEWGVHNTKKGDILSNGTIVLVVDSLGKFEGRTIINSWYYANSEKFYGNDISECDRWEIDGFRPASEAEKNFLFKMMNKEGYMWDSEKNELVDIEKPVEWSRRDQMLLDCTISSVWAESNRSNGYIDNDTARDIEKWLESFKDRFVPQPKHGWKPSEEQMVALKEACDEHWEPDGLDTLYTLYQDLKKLREE